MPLPLSKAAWRSCALACLAMVLLSLVPQINLWLVRGRNWNGAYINSQGDETLYSAYINALMNGRARKNDPFGGVDDSPAVPLPESFFSIQFLPAYAIALPARIFGVSASTAFIVLIAMTALFSSLAVFWLLNYITNDYRVAAVGTVLVLCLGRFVGRYGIFGTFLDIGFPALPFLRRYLPATVFPLFFVFQLLVWRALTTKAKRPVVVSALLGSLTLATLVFSYLYLWTATAAWMVCIGLLWFFLRPPDRRKTLLILTVIGGMTALALVPYAYMLSHRAVIGDEDLILVLTHRPDLFRTHEILGAVILVSLGLGVWLNRIERRDPRLIYVASLAVLPFVVFNQQILTGRTMQVFHFENFIVNYSTLVAALILVSLLWKPLPQRLLTWTAGFCLAWGIVSVGVPARTIFLPLAISNDRAIPVLRRLRELSKQDGTLADIHTKGQSSTLVFSPSVTLIELLPTWTSQGTLLDVTGAYCSSHTREQQKESLYVHLYYCNVQGESLRRALSDKPDQFSDALSSVRIVIFGNQRLFPYLNSQFKAIQTEEIEHEVQAYESYAKSFSRKQAFRRPITYAIIPAGRNFDFSNLDRWYERDAGELVGDHNLYRLKLRD